MRLSLPEFSLHRPVTVIMVVVTLLGLGAVAWHKIPLEFFPKMNFPFIGCMIPYPGATPEQVEKEVAIPAEGEFRTIAHLERISTSSDANGCMVNMQFDSEADMGVATAEVRDRMERLKLRLPSEVERLTLRRWSSGDMPVMVFTLFRAGNDEEFAHLARTVLHPRLMRLDGVADVTIFGKPEREVLVEFDPNSLQSRRLGFYQVVSALRASSLNVSVGEFVDGQTKYYVRALDEFARPEEIADLVIGAHGARVKDVAEVGYKVREENETFSIDGKGGVFILVQKESEANTVATCAAVREELDRLKADPVFAGTETFVFLDQGELIRATLSSLVSAGKSGARADFSPQWAPVPHSMIRRAPAPFAQNRGVRGQPAPDEASLGHVAQRQGQSGERPARQPIRSKLASPAKPRPSRPRQITQGWRLTRWPEGQR